ncbi:hypothetical protein CUZ56_02838 [Saezia sanguinis]|uniref:AraC effector-binding domain-containing protein n=1 Tax=Saezia sanguinis TaxID=1965230 RepID=A0A433SA15_9BURK|nr:GyrI-like domain-containing protein [Saezia sanguinis]RUS65539.1 hypothetical protein CUZ56_02838 [Saezia sanguinis]
MDYKFSVVELPETLIAGITVQTDMQNASQTCSALWESFEAQVINKIPAAAMPQNPDAFGVSRMLDEQRFIYWAAIEVQSADNLPAGMQTIRIPAGLYVGGQIPGLDKLSDAYTALFMQWPQSQNTYALDMQGISFELYRCGWQMHDPLSLYASVVKKE